MHFLASSLALSFFFLSVHVSFVSISELSFQKMSKNRGSFFLVAADGGCLFANFMHAFAPVLCPDRWEGCLPRAPSSSSPPHALKLGRVENEEEEEEGKRKLKGGAHFLLADGSLAGVTICKWSMCFGIGSDFFFLNK